MIADYARYNDLVQFSNKELTVTTPSDQSSWPAAEEYLFTKVEQFTTVKA